MKNIKLLFIPALIIAALVIQFIACQKEMPAINSNYEDEVEEFDDTAFEEDIEENLLEERSTSVKIFSILCDEVVPVAVCTKYGGYAKIKATACNMPDQKNRFSINGYGFGTSQGTTTLTSNIKGVNYPVTIESWSDTQIKCNTNRLAPDARAITWKFVLTKTDTFGKVRTARKSVRGVGWWCNDSDAIFPSNGWEIALQRANLGFTGWSKTITLDSIYNPVVGDVLVHSDGNRGIILSVGLPNSKGVQSVKVRERNQNCKGSVRNKTYKYSKGVFPPKVFSGVAESNYVSVLR